jgi:hypothetical protein
MEYRRDLLQQHIDALRKENQAVDRSINAKTPTQREQARRWAKAWGLVARVGRPLRRN